MTLGGDALTPAQEAAVAHAHRLLEARDAPRVNAPAVVEASERQLRELLSITIWKFSESPHKFATRALRNYFWTPAAWDYWSAHGDTKRLKHEHPFPRSVLVGRLLARSWRFDELEEEYRRRAVGVVVTRAEDKQLDGARLRTKVPATPEDADGLPHSTWARYSVVGLRVADLPGLPDLHRQSLSQLGLLAAADS